MMKKQHYMTRDERQQLEAMYRNRIPVREIAKQLGFCRATIYNELKRGQYRHTLTDLTEEIRYSADRGQQTQRYNQTAKGRPLKIGNDHAFAAFIEDIIRNERYSPAAALAAARKKNFRTNICITTLYSYIDKQIFHILSNKDLWNKSKKKQRKEACRRIVHPKYPSITDRPEYINDRSELGHWEMDLIVGKKDTRPVLLTLTERVTRQELIFKLPDRKAATIRGVFDRLEKTMPDFKDRFQSLTTDNGSEFMELEKLQTSIYGGKRFSVWYCHSYAAWEKGSNENHNRMIRRWFLKGTDFTRISKRKIEAVQNWMNNYPRKILNWYSPNEVAEGPAA